MQPWAVIANPRAGRRLIPVDQIAGALETAGVEATIHLPDSQEGAREAVRRLAHDGQTRFVAAGGDGTANLVANVLLDLDLDLEPTLGILPIGSGCDLLKTFGISMELREAARHLAGDDTYLIDVGVLEGSWGTHHFLNVAQVGVGAAAAETAPKMSRSLGTARYPIAFGVRLPRFPKAEVTITTERRTYESEALAVIMANAQFFAGGWNVAPKATLVDGVLDIQIIDTPKTRAPALVPKVIRGTHLRDPAVRRFSAAEFTIETNPVWPLEADGDLVGNTTVRGRVMPGALRLKI
jgi:diacylglycerol kinase (ATP)